MKKIQSKKIFAVIVLALLCLSMSVVGTFASDVMLSPKAQMAQTVEAVLEIVRSKTIPDQQKDQQLSVLVQGAFDYPLMAQGVLGRSWRSTAVEERQQFVELFAQLLEATYLGRIRAYTNQTVRYGDERIRKNRAVVETFIENNGVDIPLTYKLLPRKDRWLVYDVVIENVSLIRSYRSSYQNILRHKGMEALLEEMRHKIATLAQAKETARKDAA